MHQSTESRATSRPQPQNTPPAPRHRMQRQKAKALARIAKTALSFRGMPTLPLLLTSTFVLTFALMMQCNSAAAAVVEAHQNTTEADHQLAPQSLANATCRKNRCSNGCPARPISHATAHSDLIANSFSLTDHRNQTTTCLCPASCDDDMPRNCSIEHGAVLPHAHTMVNPLDPCETFRCAHGRITIIVATCAAVHCPVDQRMRTAGACCETCDPSYTNFCDGDGDCEWNCRFGFVFDEERGCDRCRCNPPPTTTVLPTTTTTLREEAGEEGPKGEEGEEKTFFVFLDATDNELLNILIVCLVFVAVVVCAVILVVMLLVLHRRIYNPVPLISDNLCKAGGAYA